MKRYILSIFSAFLVVITYGQDFNGQWKGTFIDKSSVGWGDDRCDYVLELECKGNTVTGSSYTYFTDGGKKYYTICRLQGFVNKKQKYIEVRETERVKTNVPITIRNCFQVHKLSYFKKGDTASLEGKWEPAPDQSGGCGIGTTLLVRRELKQSYPNFNASGYNKKSTTLAKKELSPAVNNADITRNGAIKPLPPKKESTKKAKPAQKDIAENKLITNPKVETLRLDTSAKNLRQDAESTIQHLKFEKRNNTVLRTIEVESKTVRIDLYDNGEVDGDSVSLFYNDKLLMSGKKLSEKPITLNIVVENDNMNELVMYAENLGSIPPNTALMVVMDGKKRYEVRITSDLQKSGVINFVHKGAQH